MANHDKLPAKIYKSILATELVQSQIVLVRSKMVLSMDRWKGKVAVVTGASAGIGAAITERLVTEGLNVVGIARRSERVQALAKKLAGKRGKLHAVRADMSKPEEVIKAFKWITTNLGPVHVLVNNAGLTQQTNLIDGDFNKWKTIIDTNILGLCVATREAVASMKANKIDGHIIHINSVVGHGVPNYPFMNVYPASKHAVTALTETLRQELNREGLKIKITDVSPGGVETEFATDFDFGKDNKRMLEMMKNRPTLYSDDLADAVRYALSTPPHVQVHELIMRAVGTQF